MGRLIRKIVIYIVAFSLVTSAIIYVGISLKPAYFLASPSDYVIAQNQYQQGRSASVFRNIVIGDSRGNSDINPRILGNSWVDLSIPGSWYVEGYFTLKHYLSVNKVDTLILFYGIEGLNEDSADFFNVRAIPWGLLSTGELAAFEHTEETLNTISNGVSVLSKMKLKIRQFRRRLRYFHFPLTYRETFVDGLGNFFTASSKSKIKQIQATIKNNLGHINFGELDSCDSIAYKNLDRAIIPRALQLAYLDSIMNLADRYHVRTFLIIPPVNQATGDAYSNSVFKGSVDSLIKSAIVKKYPELTYVNGPETMSNTLFGDPWHLNKRGTVIYSTHLRELLK